MMDNTNQRGNQEDQAAKCFPLSVREWKAEGGGLVFGPGPWSEEEKKHVLRLLVLLATARSNFELVGESVGMERQEVARVVLEYTRRLRKHDKKLDKFLRRAEVRIGEKKRARALALDAQFKRELAAMTAATLEDDGAEELIPPSPCPEEVPERQEVPQQEERDLLDTYAQRQRAARMLRSSRLGEQRAHPQRRTD